jgi:hypothetical protein
MQEIGLAMKDIDAVANCMIANFGRHFRVRWYQEHRPRVRRGAARVKIETLRTDPVIFDVWAEVRDRGRAARRLLAGRAACRCGAQVRLFRVHGLSDGLQHVATTAGALVFHIARARTPMPKSTREFIERWRVLPAERSLPAAPAPLPARPWS